jgi:hypothetical protein
MTGEDRVAYALKEFYLACPKVEIISFHPPSGKSYETALIRFPHPLERRAASKRRHVDFILRCGRFLILQELKEDAASTSADQKKLSEMRSELGLAGIVATIVKRCPRLADGPTVNRLVLSLGFASANVVIPSQFAVFRVEATGKVDVVLGDSVAAEEIAELSSYFIRP